MAQQPRVGIAIEFGELNTGLSGVLGIAKGLTSQKYLTAATNRIALRSTREFGKAADAAAASGTIAHVYEYTNTHDEVDATEAGRLWRIRWRKEGGGMIGNVQFERAQQTSKPHPLLAQYGASEHEFPDKAEHLESTRVLVSEAGIQRFTTRVSRSTNPRVLAWVDESGDTKFAKRRRRINEFQGKFQEFFMAYWAKEFLVQAEPRIARATVRTMAYGRMQSRKMVQSTSVGRPRLPRGIGGVVALDRGRPFTGVRIRESQVNKVAEQVGRRMEKELVRQWSR